jgi:hypothetical protein
LFGLPPFDILISPKYCFAYLVRVLNDIVGYNFWMAEKEALLNSKDIMEFLTSEVK